MEDIIIQLFNDIKKRPGVYFGKKALHDLSVFVSGYVAALNDINEKKIILLPKFREFLESYYNVHSVKNWSDIIIFYSKDDSDAFDNFFELLNEFLAKGGKIIEFYI